MIHPGLWAGKGLRPLVAGAALVGIVGSCAPPPRPLPTTTAEPRLEDSDSRMDAVSLARTVMETARSLVGTPYLYRGSDPVGFDCSGLMSYVFARVGIQLPRRAEDQAKAGVWVPLDELQAGDLVFFGATRLNPSHVGLVVSGPGEPLAMIHASSSRGVVETKVLSSSYWLDRLEQGRRVLPGR